MYHKVASRSISWLVADPRIFSLLIKGKFDAYVLCPFCLKTNSVKSAEARVAKDSDGKPYTHSSWKVKYKLYILIEISVKISMAKIIEGSYLSCVRNSEFCFSRFFNA